MATGGTRKANVGLGEPWRGSCGFHLCCRTSVSNVQGQSMHIGGGSQHPALSCPLLRMASVLGLVSKATCWGSCLCTDFLLFLLRLYALHGADSGTLRHTCGATVLTSLTLRHLSGVTPRRTGRPPYPAHTRTPPSLCPHALSVGREPHAGLS